MSRTTIKLAIAEELESLRQADFLKFCYYLQDRREEPRVRGSKVEGKKCWEVADIMVSTFTEPKALRVTLDILRQISCNEEAEALESKTKASVDPKTLKGVRVNRGRSFQSAQAGKALVGFGAHRSETLEGLYESKDKDKISYVNYLRTMKFTYSPGSKMEVAVRYILQRDRDGQAAPATKRPTTNFTTRAAKRKTKTQQVQSTRRYPTRASKFKKPKRRWRRK